MPFRLVPIKTSPAEVVVDLIVDRTADGASIGYARSFDAFQDGVELVVFDAEAKMGDRELAVVLDKIERQIVIYIDRVERPRARRTVRDAEKMSKQLRGRVAVAGGNYCMVELDSHKYILLSRGGEIEFDFKMNDTARTALENVKISASHAFLSLRLFAQGPPAVRLQTVDTVSSLFR